MARRRLPRRNPRTGRFMRSSSRRRRSRKNPIDHDPPVHVFSSPEETVDFLKDEIGSIPTAAELREETKTSRTLLVGAGRKQFLVWRMEDGRYAAQSAFRHQPLRPAPSSRRSDDSLQADADYNQGYHAGVAGAEPAYGASPAYDRGYEIGESRAMTEKLYPKPARHRPKKNPRRGRSRKFFARWTDGWRALSGEIEGHAASFDTLREAEEWIRDGLMAATHGGRVPSPRRASGEVDTGDRYWEWDFKKGGLVLIPDPTFRPVRAGRYQPPKKNPRRRRSRKNPYDGPIWNFSSAKEVAAFLESKRPKPAKGIMQWTLLGRAGDEYLRSLDQRDVGNLGRILRRELWDELGRGNVSRHPDGSSGSTGRGFVQVQFRSAPRTPARKADAYDSLTGRKVEPDPWDYEVGPSFIVFKNDARNRKRLGLDGTHPASDEVNNYIVQGDFSWERRKKKQPKKNPRRGGKTNPRRYATKRLQKKQAKRFKVFHADHGIKPAQMKHIQKQLEDVAPQGLFIKQINIPKRLGPVPSGLYGPAMGDDPIPRSAVAMRKRGGPSAEFRWLDPVVDWPLRPVSYAQAIGIRDGNQFTLFTVYGGPLAPQNPADPSNPDPKGAKRWWSQHALSSQQG